MEQRRQVINKYVQLGLSTFRAFELAKMPRSTYYYKPKAGRKGRHPSTHTPLVNGDLVTNEQVVELIETICLEPFLDYGADRMCMELNNRGFIINKKKVYRLMKEHNMLFPKRAKSAAQARKRVDSNSPMPTFPFQVIELDIKYVYIHGLQRNAYLLTVIDTFTRMSLAWGLDLNMKAKQVAELLKEAIKNFAVENQEKYRFRIRTDNGPQFIAQKLSDAVKELSLGHEFIKPGTPQQNGHIESFHHIVSKLITQRYEFENLEAARKTFSEFYLTYNQKRIKKELLGKSPAQFYQLWLENKIGQEMKKNKQKFFFKEKPSRSIGSPSEDVLFALQNKENQNSKLYPELI
jgi:putative transposase